MATEPWLRGPLDGVHPVAAHLIYTFEQAREELAAFTQGLSPEQVWRGVAGASVGFHLRHIAGSVDRLATYMKGELLTEQQMNFLKAESNPGADLDELLRELDTVFLRVIAQVRTIDPATYLSVRGVGRKALPTTVAGLIIHISEHTQRHLGQVILTAKIVQAAVADRAP
jgi:uncharacterized damage-inducible protein DinB